MKTYTPADECAGAQMLRCIFMGASVVGILLAVGTRILFADLPILVYKRATRGKGESEFWI